MEKAKSKRMGSKSSDTDLAKKTPLDKKTKGNNLFQGVKKRGVYVERKATKESLQVTGNASPKESTNAPKRPSRGQKHFLASVLSLLSKSSTGTQHPDSDKKPKALKTNKMVNPVDNTPTFEKEKRKKKYRSKVLNSSNYPPDTFEVLQHKKTIIHTPSVDFSCEEECEEIKWSDFLPRLVQPNSDELITEKEKKLSYLVKQVNEGRMVKDKRESKRVSIDVDEPPTLVSDNKKLTTNDPGFYNFFINLLETTFSVYNINNEVDIHDIPSNASSKVNFEIDEAVAKKLHIAPDLSRQPSKHSRFIGELKIEPDYDFTKKTPGKKKKKQYYFSKYKTPKSDPNYSFLIPQNVCQPPLFPQVPSMSQKKFPPKNSKQLLLNMLKHQLSTENHQQGEPESLYNALKVLAKNKRKSQKVLRFEKTPREEPEMIRTCKPQSLKTKFPKILPKLSDYQRNKNKPQCPARCSNYSLEVVDNDYKKYAKLNRCKECGLNNRYPAKYYPNHSSEKSNLDPDYEQPFPQTQQVIMKVKSISCPKNSRDFCCENDN